MHCIKCLSTKPLEQFSRTGNGNHRRKVCRSCRAEESRARYHRTKVLIKPVRTISGTRQCSKCEVWKPLNADNYLYRTEKTFTGWETICRECKNAKSRRWSKENREKAIAAKRSWRKANPHRLAAQKRKRVYGITDEQYQAMHDAHEGKCAICGSSKPWLNIDHDHVTGRVRGLLCKQCNWAIGLMKDDPQRLKRASEYLETH